LTPPVTRAATVTNRQGIHMRPATALINLANEFEAEIEIASGDRTVNAKSIMEVLTLGASRGTSLEIRARGGDAERAAAALAELIEGGFGEG